MKLKIVLVPALLALASCDKVKELGERATLSAREQVAEKIGKGAGATADPNLKKLVNQTQDGVVFRKDLPFPIHLQVREVRRQAWDGRLVRDSAIERKSETLLGTRITMRKLESAGNIIRKTVEEAGFSMPDSEKKDDQSILGPDPLVSLGLSSRSASFIKKDGKWKSERGDQIQNVTLAKDLAPFFDSLLIESGLSPRPLWFSETKRFNIGDKITVADETLPMLITGKASGSLSLTLEQFEAVEGHPCAVFSVTGYYTRKQFPDFDGVFTDEQVTIKSGQMWLSLIHPLILREELETIQNIQIGEVGQQHASAQGAVKLSLKRTWTPSE